jgi:hypothetical protein
MVSGASRRMRSSKSFSIGTFNRLMAFPDLARSSGTIPTRRSSNRLNALPLIRLHPRPHCRAARASLERCRYPPSGTGNYFKPVSNSYEHRTCHPLSVGERRTAPAAGEGHFGLSTAIQQPRVADGRTRKKVDRRTFLPTVHVSTVTGRIVPGRLAR